MFTTTINIKFPKQKIELLMGKLTPKPKNLEEYVNNKLSDELVKLLK